MAYPEAGPSLTAAKLTFVFDPSLLLLGFGGIICLRAGLGLLVGALIAWGLVAPALIDHGIVLVSHDYTNGMIFRFWRDSQIN